MDRVVAAIKERIEECKATCSAFTMSKIEGCTVEEHECQTIGSTLAHSEFVLILPDGRSIRVDYQSKDKSHSFSIVPDMSCIRVECSDHSNDFTDSWEERV